MSQTNLTAEQAGGSITGFDRIAIAHHFGMPAAELAEKDPLMFMTALVFVVKRREGATDDDARNAALGMTMDETMAFFAEASEEEAGKDESSEPSPVSSLTSVS